MDSDQGSTPLNLRKYAFPAWLIAAIFSAILFGASFIQIILYVRNYPKDRWELKSFVFVTFTSYIAHQIMVMHSVYVYLILSRLSLETAERLVWSVIGQAFCNAVTALVVQLFFGVRIWRMSRNNYLAAALSLLPLSAFGTTFVYAVKALSLQYLSDLDSLKTLSIAFNALYAATDIAVAASLSITLLRKKPGKHGSRTTHTMIHTLVAYCVNTGLTTSGCSIMSLIFVITLQDHYIYICFYFIIGGTYINSLLANLNGRRAIRGSSTDHIHMSGEISYALSTLDRSVELGPAQSSPDPSQKGAGHEEAPEDPSPVRVKFDREDISLSEGGTTRDTR